MDRKVFKLKHICGQGLTLIELVFMMAIVAVVSAIAVISYSGYTVASKNSKAIEQITVMSISIDDFLVDYGRFPDSLNEVGLDSLEDPWGNPYQYLNIQANPGNGGVRKDHNLVPLNSDYDLYSMGPDGSSVSPLTAAASRDDIVRANDGRFVGLATDY